ncbi:MAG: hypothetical protein U0176_19705 [Bacteroidia bacterium]
MAIDYIIAHRCEVKKELDEQAIIDLVKSRNRAEALLQRFMDQGMAREQAMNTQFGITTLKPDGSSGIETVTVASLLKQAELLDDHRETCQNCPVGNNRPFGCYDSINYPVSEAAEEWLAKMAAKAISAGLPNSILIQFILDQGVTGESFARLRESSESRYLEAKYPLEVEVETNEGPTLVIDTNQLLEMLFAVGDMGDVHQEFLLYFSGGLTIQDNAPDMSRNGIEYQVAEMRYVKGPSRYWVYRMPDSLQDDRTIRQFKAYFRSLFMAACAKANVLLDY